MSIGFSICTGLKVNLRNQANGYFILILIIMLLSIFLLFFIEWLDGEGLIVDAT